MRYNASESLLAFFAYTRQQAMQSASYPIETVAKVNRLTILLARLS